MGRLLPLRRGARVTAGLVLALLAGGLGLAWWVPLPARLGERSSPVYTWADGTVMHVALAPDDRWRLPVTELPVDPDYLAALVAYEDQRFWWHLGVDPVAIVRAAVQNLRAGRVVSGASTLTMQVVRILEPRPRTIWSKVIEALRAVQLEVRLSKAEILDAYVQFAPYGRNYEGVQTAAHVLYGHSAEHLTAAEVALLVAIPQDPSVRSPAPHREETLRTIRQQVAARLAGAGALPLGEPALGADAVLEQVHAAPVPRAFRALPRRAPHAARWLATRHRHSGVRIDSTLARPVQDVVEQAVAEVRPDAERAGVDHIAVVVVEHQTGRLRSLVGSFDFWEDRAGAQIVGFEVPRSPGSTLKPLLYALAIDDGRVLPETRVVDVPTQFGAYAPTNFDGGYDGSVRLDDALSRSLNVPFVLLLQSYGVERMLQQLRRAGIQSLHADPQHYGLSLVAGGIELTPLDLARLYVLLARDGTAIRLTADPTDSELRPVRVLHPGAAWLTRRALRLRDRPDFPLRGAVSSVPRALHWKTGTSFGHRDAWAVGSGERYTVVVWLGNFDQSPSRWLVGANAAGPVLFDILEGLQDGLTTAVPPPPSELQPVTLCALSGRLPTASCSVTRPALARVDKVPTEVCPLHHTIEVDDETGLRVTPGCRDGRQTHTRSAVVWPAEMRRWLGRSLAVEDALPELAPGCREVLVQRPPRIRSPESGLDAVLLPGVPADRQDIPLEADSASHAPLDWYVDGEWVGRARAGERAWWTPTLGVHEVVVMDADGRQASQTLTVRPADRGGF